MSERLFGLAIVEVPHAVACELHNQMLRALMDTLGRGLGTAQVQICGECLAKLRRLGQVKIIED